MSTLYIREVPDDVAATLKRRAEAQGMSLSAYVNAQLVALAQRPTNAEIVARLREQDRTQGAAVTEILDALQSGRP